MQTTVSKLIISCRRFWQKKDGGVLVYAAIAMPIFLGVVGLSVDTSIWYQSKRAAQAAADAAALAMAHEGVRTGDPDTMLLSATESAADNGFETSNGDTISFNSPPSSGDYAGSASEVEVVVERNVSGFLSRILGPDIVTVAARAVATTGSAGVGDGCIWTMDPSGAGALTVTGNAQINIGCGIHVNSSDSVALSQGGASCVNASSITVVGGASGNCLNPEPAEGVAAQGDPLATMHGSVSASIAGCDPADYTAKNNKTLRLAPGCYSGNITAKPGGTLIFQSGDFVLDDATLDFKGDVSSEVGGVSFYVTENSDEPITVNSQADIHLVAQDSGPMAGMLFYQGPDSLGGIEHTINGGADLYLEGIVYFSKDDFKINGGSSANQSPTYLIANRVKFAGGTEFGNYEGSAGESSPYLGASTGVTLVE